MAETESQALLGILFTSNQGSIPQVPKFNPGWLQCTQVNNDQSVRSFESDHGKSKSPDVQVIQVIQVKAYTISTHFEGDQTGIRFFSELYFLARNNWQSLISAQIIQSTVPV